MGRISREFVKLETRLVNDYRFFTMSEFEQLIYLKLMAISRLTGNKIPKDMVVLAALLRSERSETEITSAVDRIKYNFPKFMEGKYFYYFDGYELRFRNSVPKKGVDEEEDEDEDKDSIGTELFEQVWNRYPKRIGRKAALRYFKSSVKTPEDRLLINQALDNYIQSDTVKRGYVQYGSKWFNNWRDYVERDSHGSRPAVHKVIGTGSAKDQAHQTVIQKARAEIIAEQGSEFPVNYPDNFAAAVRRRVGEMERDINKNGGTVISNGDTTIGRDNLGSPQTGNIDFGRSPRKRKIKPDGSDSDSGGKKS